MKKNRRNNSRPAAITTAKDTTKAIETRAGVLKEAEDVKKEAKTSFYLQYMGKEISTEEITQKVHEAWKTLGKNVDEIKTLNVYLKPEEVSLAIGKGGLNIKLASMLTEYTIAVYRELGEDAVADEDIYLDEFKDEIDEWVINAIKAIGIDTAKGVLNAPREMLIEKADLEENTVDDILRILKAEFEE